MLGRLWYPQLDVFDTIRRMGALLLFFESPPGVERLCISDFFLANPPLLHKTTMPRETRRAFHSLKIPRPEKDFLEYPSAPLLFHKMAPIQDKSIAALLGKGLLVAEKYRLGKIEMSAEWKSLLYERSMSTSDEKALAEFLAVYFTAQVEVGNFELRRRSGLRRVVR